MSLIDGEIVQLNGEEFQNLSQLMMRNRELALERELAEERLRRNQCELELFKFKVARRLKLAGDWSVDQRTGEIRQLEERINTKGDTHGVN